MLQILLHHRWAHAYLASEVITVPFRSVVLLLRTLFRKFHVTSITGKPSHPSDTLTPHHTQTLRSCPSTLKQKRNPQTGTKQTQRKSPKLFATETKIQKKNLLHNVENIWPQLSTTSPFKPKRRISPPLLLVSTQEEETNPKKNLSPKKKQRNKKKADRGNYKTHKVISKLQRLYTTIKRIQPLRSEESKSLREVAQETVAVL